MKTLSDSQLRLHFLGWQCRIRQLSARELGGQPMPGMRPRVLARSGEELMAAMTLLILPQDPKESTAFFKFQLQRTHEHARAREAGVSYLAAEHFQEPERFSDEMTALFAEESTMAQHLVKLRLCLLDFEQFSQRFTMFCRVRRLKPGDEAHSATLWHNRLFNPNVPNTAIVLGFKPDWKNVQAYPMP